MAELNEQTEQEVAGLRERVAYCEARMAEKNVELAVLEEKLSAYEREAKATATIEQYRATHADADVAIRLFDAKESLVHQMGGTLPAAIQRLAAWCESEMAKTAGSGT